METALKIRRLCLVEGKSISEVARRFHLSRTTVRKYLKDEQPPGYHLNKPRERPRLGDYEATLARWLAQDQARPKREQRTAMRLFEDLQKDGYTGAYDSVVRFVRAYRQDTNKTTDAFIPLSFDPGDSYQFDWSHEMVELGGMPQKIKVAHFRLSHSLKPFVVAYPRESLEMVLDAHMRALSFYQGVPQGNHRQPEDHGASHWRWQGPPVQYPLSGHDEPLPHRACCLYAGGGLGEGTSGESGSRHPQMAVYPQTTVPGSGQLE